MRRLKNAWKQLSALALAFVFVATMALPMNSRAEETVETADTITVTGTFQYLDANKEIVTFEVEDSLPKGTTYGDLRKKYESYGFDKGYDCWQGLEIVRWWLRFYPAVNDEDVIEGDISFGAEALYDSWLLTYTIIRHSFEGLQKEVVFSEKVAPSPAGTEIIITDKYADMIPSSVEKGWRDDLTSEVYQPGQELRMTDDWRIRDLSMEILPEEDANGFMIEDGLLVRYNGQESEVAVPDGVTRIARGAFSSNSFLQKVVLPQSVSHIGDSAFAGCNNLQSIQLPEGLSYIGEYAFWETGLKAITIPATVTSIEKNAFGSVSGQKVTIYGEEGSYALQYAKENGIPYAVGEAPETGGDEPPTGGDKIPAGSQDEAVDIIKDSTAKDTVVVDMKDTTTVKKDVLTAAKGKDVNVELDMGGYSWIINGQDITSDDLKEINLEAKIVEDAIPQNVLKQLAGKEPVKQLSLTHNGEFGFTATLRINVGKEYAGQYGNLFYYNKDGKFEFMNAGEIDADGFVDLKFSHASDYAIKMTAQPLSQKDVPASLQPGSGTPVTGDTLPVMPIVVMMILAAGVIAVSVMKLKKNR